MLTIGGLVGLTGLVVLATLVDDAGDDPRDARPAPDSTATTAAPDEADDAVEPSATTSVERTADTTVAVEAVGATDDEDGSIAEPDDEVIAPVVEVTLPPELAAWSVLSITDGDTLDLSGPDGAVTVRLIGINAPEVGECLAAEATDALRTLVGTEVLLVADVSDVDQYGRALRFVETLGGLDVGGELVRLGLAISNRYEPDVARNDRYEQLQAEAEAQQVGRWAPDACGAPVGGEASVAIDIRYDADGNDNQNKNDEWVRFTNTGAGPLDISGWQVADESSVHRYTFRSLVLPPGGSVTLFTGCGSDSDAERYWCNQRSAIWNNDGDTVFLNDANGNLVTSQGY